MKMQQNAAAPFGPDDLARVSGAQAGPAGRSEPSEALSKLIEAAANLDTRPPVSPVVLGGVTRLAESGLMMLALARLLLWSGASALASTVTVLAMTGVASAAWHAMRLYKVQVLRAPATALRRMVPVLVAVSAGAAGLSWCFGHRDLGAALALWLVAAVLAVTVGGGRTPGEV